jgi:hypothetical protein
MDEVGKLTMTTNTCPECGKVYKQIGNHWQHRPSHIHSLTPRQHEIVKGLVIGDGHICMKDRNAMLIVGSTNREFLSWLSEEFPVISRTIRKSKSVDYLIKQNTESEWVDTPSDDCEYNPMYRWNTVTHPNFNDYLGDAMSIMELSSLSLKVWYVSDGTLVEAGNHWCPSFSVTDVGLKEHLAELLRDVGFTVTSTTGMVYIKQSETVRFFECIGDPIPGFEDKWL